MRIHRPIPILLILLPILIVISGEIILDISNNKIVDFDYFLMITKLVVVSCVGSFVVRSLGCVINDFFDKDIDVKTERSKIRPLVDESQNKKNRPTTFGVGILCLCLGMTSILLAIYLGKIPIILSFCAAVLIIFYPLTKRAFVLPQLFLGVTYNFGILIICSSVEGWLNAASIVFFITNIVWTFAYDTVYAMQDVEDDRKNDLNSSALLIECDLIPVVKKLYNGILLLLIVFSVLVNGKLIYISILVLFWKTKTYIEKLNQTKNYQDFFEKNWKLFGVLLLGVLSDIVLSMILK